MTGNFTKLIKELQQELEDILKFWSTYCLDHEFGGFVGRRDHFNRQIAGASKGAVLNARILWTFSAAYRFTRNQDFLILADRAYQYITEHFKDKLFGGLFWEVSEKGEVMNGRKQIYAQGFGIYGFSEYFRASKNPAALREAISLFELIEKFSFDHVDGGYLEALSNDWSILEDFRLSPKDANEPKSMNTHLHLLESYTNLLKVWPDEELRKKITALIRIFLDRITDRRTNHLNLFFGNDWSVRSSIVSYGHDIEGAWLLSEAAKVVGEMQLIAETEKNLIRMVDVTLVEGCDEDGSVFNEKEVVSGYLDTDKHWWMQAEAMVGLAYAYKISGNEIYPDCMVKIWDFICKTMIDRLNGEWFWRVNKLGVPVVSEDKAGFWKCPYHNSRAIMEVLTILEQVKNIQ
jgi:mannobiose 2-epimerase